MENMDKNAEKFLAQMVEGYEMNLPQLDTAIEQLSTQIAGMTEQLEKMTVQRETLTDELIELKELLGLEDAVESDPKLTLVTE